MQSVHNGFSSFTTVELARLAAYKGAVTAGMYSDWDGSAEGIDTQTLAWLTHAPEVAGVGYPFTTDELRRLTVCRAAVVAGYYSEDAPVAVQD
jgi:hypothetical protein